MNSRLLTPAKNVVAVLAIGLAPAIILLAPRSSPAQDSYYYAGELEGEKVLVNLSSISTQSNSTQSNSDATFEYLLGDRTITAQAHCIGADAWTTLANETTHYAQSQTSRNMLRIVCGHSDDSSALSTPSASTPTAISRPAPTENTSTAISIRPSVSPIEPPTPASLPTPIEPPTPSDSPSDLPVDIAVEPYRTISSSVAERTPDTQTALVYDPSSNVRATPNGQILCSVDTVSYINIYGNIGDWYDTDVCGMAGVIHISQISFE